MWWGMHGNGSWSASGQRHMSISLTARAPLYPQVVPGAGEREALEGQGAGVEVVEGAREAEEAPAAP